MEGLSKEDHPGNTGSDLVHDNSEKKKMKQMSINKLDDSLGWETAAENPRNWPTWRKIILMAAISSAAITAYVCLLTASILTSYLLTETSRHRSMLTSIITPARTELMKEFQVSSTVAILSVSLYVFALGFGSVVGGPLSETVGRYPVYMGSIILGSAFTIGVGFARNFGALLFLRFMAGFSWASVISVAPGILSETFLPTSRGPASAIFILMPFLGPGLGYIRISSLFVTFADLILDP